MYPGRHIRHSFMTLLPHLNRILHKDLIYAGFSRQALSTARQFTCFTSTKVQMLTSEKLRSHQVVQQVLVLVGQGVLSLAISRGFAWSRRRAWLNDLVVRREVENIGNTLGDLVPTFYCSQLMKTNLPGAEYTEGQAARGKHRVAGGFAGRCKHRVVALQLDICGFSTLSCALSEVELADTVHSLFSDFDDVIGNNDTDAVFGNNFFKIDTIGDAYIIFSWLHGQQEGGSTESTRKSTRNLEAERDEDAAKCADMLRVAEAMLEMVQKHNQTRLSSRRSGPLNVRIGVATGSVVAGVLGEPRKRFSVQGEAMEHIAYLESRAQPGKVQCSADLMNILSNCAAGQRLLAHWDARNVPSGHDSGFQQVESGSYQLTRMTDRHDSEALMRNRSYQQPVTLSTAPATFSTAPATACFNSSSLLNDAEHYDMRNRGSEVEECPPHPPPAHHPPAPHSTGTDAMHLGLMYRAWTPEQLGMRYLASVRGFAPHARSIDTEGNFSRSYECSMDREGNFYRR